MSFQKNPPWQKGNPQQAAFNLQSQQQNLLLAGYQNQGIFNNQQNAQNQFLQQSLMQQIHSQIPVSFTFLIIFWVF